MSDGQTAQKLDISSCHAPNNWSDKLDVQVVPMKLVSDATIAVDKV